MSSSYSLVLGTRYIKNSQIYQLNGRSSNLQTFLSIQVFSLICSIMSSSGDETDRAAVAPSSDEDDAPVSERLKAMRREQRARLDPARLEAERATLPGLNPIQKVVFLESSMQEYIMKETQKKQPKKQSRRSKQSKRSKQPKRSKQSKRSKQPKRSKQSKRSKQLKTTSQRGRLRQ